MRALALAAALAGAAAGSLSPGLGGIGGGVIGLGASAQAAHPAASTLATRVHDLVEDAIRAHQLPGAVVIAGHGDRVLVREAFGARAIEPAREPMSVDTVFDAASLTK